MLKVDFEKYLETNIHTGYPEGKLKSEYVGLILCFADGNQVDLDDYGYIVVKEGCIYLLQRLIDLDIRKVIDLSKLVSVHEYREVIL